MLRCWNECPSHRPTFTILRQELEDIITAGDSYFTIDVDEDNNYYAVASFKSATDENEFNDDLEDGLLDDSVTVKNSDN